MPGSSEHQTGLSIDVSSDSVGCALEESFGATADGKWLAKNCHKYGFIIRYPKNKTKITGYSYEPWHIRYVGRKLATYLYKNDLTLEEYYETTTVDQQIKEPQGQIRDVAEDDKNETEIKTAPTPNPNHKASSTTRQYSNVTATKAPATKRPSATRKPAKKTTPKPAAKTPAPTKQQDTSQEGSQTPSTTVEQTPSQDVSSETAGTVEQDTTSESRQTEDISEEIDLGVE
jgi:hypothetical protein